jgi:hypothetical protein
MDSIYTLDVALGVWLVGWRNALLVWLFLAVAAGLGLAARLQYSSTPTKYSFDRKLGIIVYISLESVLLI